MNTGTNSRVILVKSIPCSGGQLPASVNVDLRLSQCFLNFFCHIQSDFCHIKITCILSTFCLNVIFFFNLTCFLFRFILSNSIHGIINIYQCFSTRGDFDPQRTSGNVWRHFRCPNWGSNSPGTQWVEPSGAAKHPTGLRTPPQQRMILPTKAVLLTLRNPATHICACTHTHTHLNMLANKHIATQRKSSNYI